MTWTTRRRSDFGALAAIRAGSGAPVLLLHGVGLRAEAWNAVLDALCGDYAVTAPDMPGHGQSLPLGGRPALTGYTDRIADALHEPVVVAGHSMGAMIALDLAIRYPGRVRAVAAFNAVYRRTDAARRAVLARAGALDGERIPDPAPTLRRWFGAAPSPAAGACENWLRGAHPAGYRDAYAVFAAEDGPPDDSLAALACPALFMTGGADPNSTPAMAAAMADLAPRGRAATIEDAAHMMPMTHAAPVSAVLRDLVRDALA